MKLSVIIPSYQQDAVTLVHVREANNSTRPPDEIIVINDGGEDSLLEELQKIEFRTKVIYAKINEDIPWNYPGACNLGIWLSTGDLVFFEDNDNIPTREIYGQMEQYMIDHPEIARASARGRIVVKLEDVINKPLEEWKQIDSMGPNQGTACFRREVLLDIKGHDERFSGEYGYMYVDLRRKLLNRAKVHFGSIGQYYYIHEGQTKLSRSMSARNYSHLRHNTRDDLLQSPIGILNFTYQIKTLHP